jgi:hypothetical protein
MAIIKINSAKISAHIGINYVCNKEKTLGKLISGKDCMPESCYDEFEMVREQNNQQGGRTYYHMIQSFAPEDKITPEQCHAIGLQMAEHCFDGYQVLVATHVDKEHMHNHFIINSVNFKTGKKMNMHPNDLVDIKNYSNELCQQYGFVTTETKTRRNQNPKWKKNIQYWALKMMKQSYDMDGFIFNMRMHGITVKYDKDYKYMTYTDIDGHRCRDSKLFDERLLKKNLEMYFDLGGSVSLIAQDIENYKTPSSGNCTDGLTESIFELIANLQVPSNQSNGSGYDEDDEELDKIVRKMRAHGLKVTKAQLAYCRNSNANYEQEQVIGLFY